MDLNEKVLASSTAAWMAGCRSNREYCEDSFACYWINKPSWEKYLAYIDEVSETEDDTLSLRFQFFFGQLILFMEQNPDAVFVNVGSGFASYPYLLPKNGQYVEVDCESIINEKMTRAAEWTVKGILPRRNISYMVCDLNTKEKDGLFSDLKRIVNGRKSFILFEGLLYYINEQSVKDLFALTSEIQTPGSLIGTASWPMDTFTRPVYQRFDKFLTKVTGKKLEYICHDVDYFSKIKGYELIKHTTQGEMSTQYPLETPLTPEVDYFEEDLCILRKV